MDFDDMLFSRLLFSNRRFSSSGLNNMLFSRGLLGNRLLLDRSRFFDGALRLLRRRLLLCFSRRLLCCRLFDYRLFSSRAGHLQKVLFYQEDGIDIKGSHMACDMHIVALQPLDELFISYPYFLSKFVDFHIL